MVWKAQEGTKRSKETKQKERQIQSILFLCHSATLVWGVKKTKKKHNFFISFLQEIWIFRFELGLTRHVFGFQQN